MKCKKNSIFISIGEYSAEYAAFPLIKTIVETYPDIEIYGLCGKNIKSLGVNSLYDYGLINSGGFIELIPYSINFVSCLSKIIKQIHKNPPKYAILVDLPDFNFLLARVLKSYGTKIIYYIPPQIWAWRKNRVKFIKKYVDNVVVFYPFEEEFFKNNGVKNIIRVKHPLATLPLLSPKDALNKLGISNKEDKKYIALLPGSRIHELNYHLPILIEVIKSMLIKRKDLYFLIPLPEHLRKHMSKKIYKFEEVKKFVSIIYNVYDFPSSWLTMRCSDIGLVALGTATLEATLAQLDIISFYKTSKISFEIGKLLININNFALPNIILNQKIIPEFIQNQAEPQLLSNALLTMLERKKDIQIYNEIRNTLSNAKDFVLQDIGIVF